MIKSIKQQRMLPLKYQRLTSVIGVIGVSLGLAIFYKLLEPFSLLLGIDLDLPGRLQENYQLSLFLLFVLMVVSIYVGAVCVSGSFSLLMCILRKFTIREALSYTFFSKFPRSWN